MVEGWTEYIPVMRGPNGFIRQLQPASYHLKLHASVFMCEYTCGFIRVGAGHEVNLGFIS